MAMGRDDTGNNDERLIQQWMGFKKVSSSLLLLLHFVQHLLLLFVLDILTILLNCHEG